MFSNELVFFCAFYCLYCGYALLDLGIFSKRSHIVSFKEAAAWSSVCGDVCPGILLYYKIQGRFNPRNR